MIPYSAAARRMPARRRDSVSSMGQRARAVAAGLAAALLAGLVFVTVHPGTWPAWLGAVPLAAATWAVFAAGAWLTRGLGVRWSVALIVLGAIAIQLAALSAPPQGSDDLYRYIWDGRVQAAGIDPYRYVPAAPELVPLRDPSLWPARAPHCVPPGARAFGTGEPLLPGCTRINRPTVPTIYPPVAEAYFLAVHGTAAGATGSLPIQAGAALCALATTGVLLLALRRLGRDARLAVLWAWCPAVALEAGNSAHVDVLAVGLAAGALWVLARPGRTRRSLAGGALLGLAIATKLTPALLAPAVARRRWPAVAAAALAATALVYLPHLVAVGTQVTGFIPGYVKQQGYASGSGFELIGLLAPGRWAIVAAFVVLALVALATIRSSDPDRPWRGALVMTGAALVVTTPPYPWYSLLLVMLVGLDGRAEWLALAAARYLVGGSPPPPHPLLTVGHAEQAGYALALAVILAGWFARRRGTLRQRPSPVPLPHLVSDPGVVADRGSGEVLAGVSASASAPHS